LNVSTKAILVPLLNPNEPQAVLVSLHVHPGQKVDSGDLLCILETTKSTNEVLAESAGYVTALHFSAGQMVNAGDVLCYLADSPDEPLPSDTIQQNTHSHTEDPPAWLRITQPALVLARQHNLDLNNLPHDTLVTENLVRRLLEQSSPSAAATEPQIQPALASASADPQAIFIFGGGGHAKAIIDLLRALHTYHIVGIIDDHQPRGAQVFGVPLLGGSAELPRLYNQGVRMAVNAVGGISNIQTRIQVFERLTQAGFVCPTLVHPTAWVEPSASLSAAIQVFPHAYVGSEARIGFGCIINTGAIISHDCVLEDYVNLSPAAVLAGEVNIGAGTLVGMGVTVNLRTTVGKGARIGNSAVVKGNVADNAIVRAGNIHPK